MSFFTVFTMFMAVTGYVAWGWTMGVRDAGGKTIVLKPWATIVWATLWMALTLTDVGWQV